MGLFSTLGNVATGGISGLLSHPSFKNLAMGGFAPGGRKTGGLPQVNPSAQAYFNQQSPADQANIRSSWVDPNNNMKGPWNALKGLSHGNNMMNQWYENAQAAGSAPQPQPAAAQAPSSPAMTMNPVAGGQGYAQMPMNVPQPQPAATAQAAPIAQMLGQQFPAPQKLGYEDWKAQSGQAGQQAYDQYMAQ